MGHESLLAKINSDGGFSTSLFKELPEINEEVREFLDRINSDKEWKAFSTGEIIKVASDLDIADQNLLNYINTTERSKISLEGYTAYLKANTTQLNLNSIATHALAAAKSLNIDVYTRC